MTQDHQTLPSERSQVPPLPRALSKRTAFLLQVATQRAQRMGEDALAETGISGREYGVLALLEGGSRSSQRQIGAALGIDRTTTTALLKELEERRLVQRTPDALDRRANTVTLTDAGELVRAAAALVLADCEDRYLQGLDSAERQTLHRILQRLVNPQ